MATISLSLIDLFEKAFGYKTQAFDPQFSQLPLRTEVSKYGAPYYADDVLGREYFMPVTLTYTVNNNTKTFDLPYPVISISCTKTIIETPLTERRGTVKELINSRDYEITIRGLIINTTNDLPEDAVITLREIFEQNAPLQIKSALTDIFLLRPDRNGSDEVVIREINFPFISGVKNIRPYELNLVSDEPFNLTDIS